MELYYEEEKQTKKKSKAPIFIGIFIILLVLLTTIIFYAIMYIKTSILKVKINGVSQNDFGKLVQMTTTSDNKTYDATLLGTYSDNDIAVLKINATNLKPATFANSDKLVQGQSTYAVGNPEGTFSDSITSGIVSALNRKITVQLDNDDSSSSSDYGRFGQLYSSSKTISISVIQTDAAVSPGNSGGGLFNGNGDLIGIVNAKSSDTNSEGLGFAIPSNTALKIAKELINKSN